MEKAARKRAAEELLASLETRFPHQTFRIGFRGQVQRQLPAGWATMCQHNRKGYNCKECQGGGICKHNKHRATCKDCEGSGICIHEKLTYACRECDGPAFCVHDKHKSICMECGGSALCAHGKRKQRCGDCGGSALCVHSRRKDHCIECGTGVCACGTRLAMKDGVCGRCHPNAVPTLKGSSKPACKFIDGLA